MLRKILNGSERIDCNRRIEEVTEQGGGCTSVIALQFLNCLDVCKKVTALNSQYWTSLDLGQVSSMAASSWLLAYSRERKRIIYFDMF